MALKNWTKLSNIDDNIMSIWKNIKSDRILSVRRASEFHKKARGFVVMRSTILFNNVIGNIAGKYFKDIDSARRWAVRYMKHFG